MCVSLRWPTMGETSGMAIRALSLGRLLVSDAGWFSELPDSVAAKVPVDEFEVTTLAAVHRSSRRGRRASGPNERGRRRVRPPRARSGPRRRPLEANEEVAGRPAVRDAVLDDVAHAAHEVGIGVYDPELTEVAGRAREVGLATEPEKEADLRRQLDEVHRQMLDRDNLFRFHEREIEARDADRPAAGRAEADPGLGGRPGAVGATWRAACGDSKP